VSGKVNALAPVLYAVTGALVTDARWRSREKALPISAAMRTLMTTGYPDERSSSRKRA
jgi:hypothetical protein